MSLEHRPAQLDEMEMGMKKGGSRSGVVLTSELACRNFNMGGREAWGAIWQHDLVSQVPHTTAASAQTTLLHLPCTSYLPEHHKELLPLKHNNRNPVMLVWTFFFSSNTHVPFFPAEYQGPPIYRRSIGKRKITSRLRLEELLSVTNSALRQIHGILHVIPPSKWIPCGIESAKYIVAQVKRAPVPRPQVQVSLRHSAHEI